jgi:hypothetical protein
MVASWHGLAPMTHCNVGMIDPGINNPSVLISLMMLTVGREECLALEVVSDGPNPQLSVSEGYKTMITPRGFCVGVEEAAMRL